MENASQVKSESSDGRFTFELRPHHVIQYFLFEREQGIYNMPDNEFIQRGRDMSKQRAEAYAREHGQDEDAIKRAGNHAYSFHSDRVRLQSRFVAKTIHDNPDTKFRYVSGLDSICGVCDKKEGCGQEGHWQYRNAMKADEDAIAKLPMLEFGKVYSGHDLNRMLGDLK